MNALLDLIQFVCEFGMKGLALCIPAALYAALLAAIVLPINILCRHWMSASQMSLLWGLVLLRLLLPYGPSSVLSLERLIATEAAPPSVSLDGLPDAFASIEATQAPAAALNAVPTSEAADSVSFEELLSQILMLVWPLVAMAILVWTVLANWRFARRVNAVASCTDSRLLSLWDCSCSMAGVRKRIAMIVFDGVSQPAVMGVFRVKLLLPSDAVSLADEQLQMIMLHELAHIRRRDVAVNWLIALIRAVHWWNPAYWLAAARFGALREQACDAFVLRCLKDQTSRSYGELLLMLAQQTPAVSRWRILVPTPILGFLFSAFRRRSISSRLQALPRAAIRRSKWQKVIVGISTIAIAYCGLTNVGISSVAPSQEASFFPDNFERADVLTSADTVSDEPLITRNYEVDQVLKKIAGQRYSLEDAKHRLIEVWPLAPHKNHPDVEFSGTTMTVTARESFHAELKHNLVAWEKSGLEQIAIEFRFITFRQEKVSRMSIPWRYFAASSSSLRMASLPNSLTNDPELPPLSADSDSNTVRASAQFDEPLPVVYAILNPQQMSAVINAAQGDPRRNIIQAPKATVFNGMRCSLSDVSQRPFVVGVTPVAGDSATALRPEIAVADEGTKVFLRPVLSADRHRIQLAGKFEFSQISDVQSASLMIENAEASTIQVPKLKRLQIEIATELKDGDSLLVGSLIDRLDEDRKTSNMYILLTPRVISDEGDSAK